MKLLTSSSISILQYGILIGSLSLVQKMTPSSFFLAKMNKREKNIEMKKIERDRKKTITREKKSLTWFRFEWLQIFAVVIECSGVR